MPRLKLASSAAHVDRADARLGRGLHLARRALPGLRSPRRRRPPTGCSSPASTTSSTTGSLIRRSGVPWPGWQLDASANFGPEGGLWRDLPELNGYLARVQAVAAGGRSRRRTCCSSTRRATPGTPGESWFLQNPVPPAFEETGSPPWEIRGFAWDAVSERRLAEARVEDGRVLLVRGRLSSARRPADPADDAPRCRPAPGGPRARGCHGGAGRGCPPTSRGGTRSRPGGLRSRRRCGRSGSSPRRPPRGGSPSVKGSVLVGDDVLSSCSRRPESRREPMADAGLRFVRREPRSRRGLLPGQPRRRARWTAG